MNIKQLKEFLPYAQQAKVSVMIHGPHGIGKSQAVKQYAQENGMEFIDRRLSQMESGDLLGLPDLSGGYTRFMTPSWLPKDPTSKGILFLDEINRARRDVLQGVFQLVLDRQLGDYSLPEGWTVVSAVNPNTDEYDVTNVFDKALMDRFLHVKLTPTTEEFIAYAQQRKEANQNFVTFLQSREELIEDSKLREFPLDITPSRRSNMKAAELIEMGLPDHLFVEGIGGLIGATNAVAFRTWLKENEVKPLSAKEIMGDYEKIQERVEKYADSKTGRHDVISASLDNLYNELESNHKKVKDKHVAAILFFLTKLPRDLAFGFVKRITTNSSQELQTFALDKFLESEGTDWLLDKTTEAPVETQEEVK